MTNISLMAILTLRSQWEDMTRRYKMPDNNGTIDNLKWFIENGHQGNRLRRRFSDAYELAVNIIEMVDVNDRSDLSNSDIQSEC